MRDGGADEHGKPDWKGWEWSGMMHGVGCIRMWLKKSETRGEAKAKALSGAQKSVSNDAALPRPQGRARETASGAKLVGCRRGRPRTAVARRTNYTRLIREYCACASSPERPECESASTAPHAPGPPTRQKALGKNGSWVQGGGRRQRPPHQARSARGRRRGARTSAARTHGLMISAAGPPPARPKRARARDPSAARALRRATVCPIRA